MSVIDELKKQILDINMSAREIKKMGLAFFIILGIIGSLFWWQERPYWFTFCGLGLVMGLCGIFWPKGLRPFYRVWMGLAIIMNFIIIRAILILLYYLVLTPTGLIFKVLGRDILDRRLKDRPSYWCPRQSIGSSNEDTSSYVVSRQGSRKIFLIINLWMFLCARKKFFLLPIILILILLGFLILMGEGSIAPFIYTLF